MADKKTLRKEYSALRKRLKNDAKDDIITSEILSAQRVKAADLVLLYASFGSEVDTWKIAEQLIAVKKAVAFPKCGENGIMTFHMINDLSLLRDGKYGISEPDASLPQPEITDKTVCIVPGLAFTLKGGRLGYGGGFYDRFLAENSGIYRIALAYEGLIADDLPLLPHDLKVDMIVTEERTVLCNG